MRNGDARNISYCCSKANRSLVMIVGNQGDFMTLTKLLVAERCFENISLADMLWIISNNGKVMGWVKVL
jgi:hypothetical protein